VDREGFRKFLKKEGKSLRVTNATIAHAEEFELFLKEHRRGKALDEAVPQDLDAFIFWIEKGEALAAKKYMLGIRYFYEFIQDEEMASLASFRWNERMTSSGVPLKLKELRGVNATDLMKLENAGIRNVNEMINAGKTPAKREELSAKTGVSIATILELVKLSDLTRIQGVKGIRARLYHDAGVDTMEKIARWNPAELREILTQFIEKTRFNGIAPLAKEVRNTVEIARRIPKIIEY
jgi:predicted flap endonuclease-1-like 5' DNA nuclease